jgi:hypothetical protein
MLRVEKAVACIISLSILALGQIAWAQDQAIEPMTLVPGADYSELDLTSMVLSNKAMTISGSGEGELQITLSFTTTVPVVSGSYNYDVSGFELLPLSTPVQLKSSGAGYDLTAPGILVPSKPNDITLTASPVRSMNVGVVRLDENANRPWTSRQFQADQSNQAVARSDLLYPNPMGMYRARVFGEAPLDATMVQLTVTAEKRVVINGPFDLVANTAGFPQGRYSLRARAISGSFEQIEFGFA